MIGLWVKYVISILFSNGSLNTYKWLDHFCLSTHLCSNVISSGILDEGENLSDHLLIILELGLNSDSGGLFSGFSEWGWSKV